MLGLAGIGTELVPDELSAASFPEAADFAELAEELSRRIEYLQLLAAAAVDRTRTEAINAAGPASRTSGWTTGWGSEPFPAIGVSAESSIASSAEPSKAATATVTGTAAPICAPTWSPADDGCRNTAEFLRIRLRISAGEARRRLALGTTTLPRTGLAGQPMPPRHEETAAALASGAIASRAGTIIATALDKVRHIPDPAALTRMEQSLTQTAIENDHDVLARIARRWVDAIDQDGSEPSEEELRHRQGAFIRRTRRGLHHLEIFATTDQFENLLTVMNTATNPRITTVSGDSSGAEGDSANGDSGGDGRGNGSDDGCSDGLDGTASARIPDQDAWTGAPTTFDERANTSAAGPDPVFNDHAPDLDRRTRAQQLLDGLVGACKSALASATLPATGGLRPQVLVTISYQDPLNLLETTATQGPRYTNADPGAWATDSNWQTRGPDSLRNSPGVDSSNPASPGNGVRETSSLRTGFPETSFPSTGFSDQASPAGFPETGSPGTMTGSGTFTYTGPVTASIIRKIACDADIVPVLLGGEGRVLDIGRTTRIFPSHIRKALVARDQGCAFPNCTIPAPWCEAHHITYWSQGGSTSTDNGVLLCTHHHHLIHKEQWKIQVKIGIPWFTPPPHIDPRQNHHHRT